MPRKEGRTQGFAYLTFDTREQAAHARKDLSGASIREHTLRAQTLSAEGRCGLLCAMQRQGLQQMRERMDEEPRLALQFNLIFLLWPQAPIERPKKSTSIRDMNEVVDLDVDWYAGR